VLCRTRRRAFDTEYQVARHQPRNSDLLFHAVTPHDAADVAISDIARATATRVHAMAHSIEVEGGLRRHRTRTLGGAGAMRPQRNDAVPAAPVID